MKKISLKDVKNGLKRDEMRVVSGGSGTGMYCTSNFVCSTMFGYRYMCAWGFCRPHN